MRKPIAFAVMLAAALGLAACDKASENKAQDAQEHAEQAQKKMDDAQDKMNDAAKENAEAAKDSAEAEQKRAEENNQAAPVTPAPEAARQNLPSKQLRFNEKTRLRSGFFMSGQKLAKGRAEHQQQ